MITATLSGPRRSTVSRISPSSRAVIAAGSARSGARNMLVVDTWVTSTGGGPKISLKPGTPVNASAPSVTPW